MNPIAPKWGWKLWMSMLKDLLIDISGVLPVKERLLKMPSQWVLHPDQQLLSLVAWKIGGENSKRRDFKKRLVTSVLLPGKGAQRCSTPCSNDELEQSR